VNRTFPFVFIDNLFLLPIRACFGFDFTTIPYCYRKTRNRAAVYLLSVTEELQSPTITDEKRTQKKSHTICNQFTSPKPFRNLSPKTNSEKRRKNPTEKKAQTILFFGLSIYRWSSPFHARPNFFRPLTIQTFALLTAVVVFPGGKKRERSKRSLPT